MFWSLVVCFMHFAPWVLIHILVMHLTCTLDAPCCTHSNTWHVLHFTHASLVFLDLLAHITCSCVYVIPRFISCSIILSMSCSLCFIAFYLFIYVFVLWLSFIFSFILHSSYIIPLLISSFLSFIPLDCFVYSWQKGREYTGEYTGLYRHFYTTHVHTLRGSNSTSCTFVEGESYRGDAYTKREKTFSLFCFGLYYTCALSWIVPKCIYFMYFALVEYWTYIYPYAIVLYWLHIQMIICFAIWSL